MVVSMAKKQNMDSTLIFIRGILKMRSHFNDFRSQNQLSDFNNNLCNFSSGLFQVGLLNRKLLSLKVNKVLCHETLDGAGRQV